MAGISHSKLKKHANKRRTIGTSDEDQDENLSQAVHNSNVEKYLSGYQTQKRRSSARIRTRSRSPLRSGELPIFSIYTTIHSVTSSKDVTAVDFEDEGGFGLNLEESGDSDEWSFDSSTVLSKNLSERNDFLNKDALPRSNNSLQDLRTSVSPVHLAFCGLHQPEEHNSGLNNLSLAASLAFNRWMTWIREGHSIVLYGTGSKYNLLQTFQKQILNGEYVIVVNGFFPSLSLKEILDRILTDFFQEIRVPVNTIAAIELIKQKFTSFKSRHLCLVVHNIDGPMLRDNISQTLLSSLAEISNVHLIASIDHIGIALKWDDSMLCKYNFVWEDSTSLISYNQETAFETSLLAQKSGDLALSSLTRVYQSLTKNSKGIFLLIVKYQLENKSVKYYQGMPFKQLYSRCRENFLVSSDLVLRAQMTEFFDHKVLKIQRSVDGTEHLTIPINNTLLQQFFENYS